MPLKLLYDDTHYTNFVMGSTGDLTISTAGKSSALVLTDAGFLGIGTPSPVTKLQVVDTITTSPRGIMSSQYNDGTDGARLHLRKGRGTLSAPSTVVSGDLLGRIVGSGYDGSSYLEMAAIDFYTSGTIASTRIPSEIRFNTATDAAPSVLTERVRINNAGNLGIGTASISARLHALSTTEQLRLGYDDAKYSSFTVNSAGDLTLSSSNATLLTITGAGSIGGGGYVGNTRLALTNTDTSVDNVCSLDMHSGEGQSYLRISKYGSENTSPYLSGKGVVQSTGCNLVLQSDTNGNIIEFKPEGLVTKVEMTFDYTRFFRPIVTNNDVDGTSSRGIQLWNSNDKSWAIYMGQSGATKSFNDDTACTALDGSTVHHLRMRAYDGAARGFLWENSSEVALMSLTADTGNLWTKGYLSTKDAKCRYGNSLIKTGLVIDSTHWYRVLQLSGGYCQWVDLLIRIPLGHSSYRVRLSKATGGNGAGWNIEYDLGGIYNYTVGNISGLRVVDLGSNNYTYLDIKFNGNATKDIEMSILNEAGTVNHTTTYALLVACTDQGTTPAGKVYDLTYFSFDTTTIGTTHIAGTAHGGYFSHLSNSTDVSSRWFSTNGTDVLIRAANAAGVFGTRSSHPVNFVSGNSTRMILEADGDLVLNHSLNTGTRTGSLINFWTDGVLGIGLQTSTLYLRSTGLFSFYIGGVHSDNAHTPGSGGGEVLFIDKYGLNLDPNLSQGSGVAWYRSNGPSGWYNQTHGGGIFMNDATFLKVYNSKSVNVSRNWDGYYGNVHLSSDAPSITLWDTSGFKWMMHCNADAFSVWRTATTTEAAGDWVQKMSLDNTGRPLFPALAGSGNRYVYSDPNGVLTNTASDRRLKTHITSLAQGMRTVLAMNPVEFDWIDPKRGEHDIGLIAQEIQELIPEAVGTNSDGMLSLDYPKLIPILINAIKELKTEIDNLKRRL